MFYFGKAPETRLCGTERIDDYYFRSQQSNRESYNLQYNRYQSL